MCTKLIIKYYFRQIQSNRQKQQKNGHQNLNDIEYTKTKQTSNIIKRRTKNPATAIVCMHLIPGLPPHPKQPFNLFFGLLARARHVCAPAALFSFTTVHCSVHYIYIYIYVPIRLLSCAFLLYLSCALPSELLYCHVFPIYISLSRYIQVCIIQCGSIFIYFCIAEEFFALHLRCKERFSRRI